MSYVTTAQQRRRPQRRRRREEPQEEEKHQEREQQHEEEKIPTQATMDMSRIQEAINGLSRKYLESQEQQRSLQMQMMEQQSGFQTQMMDYQRELHMQLMKQQEQHKQLGESICMINQRQNQQEEATHKLFHNQEHQEKQIQELGRRQKACLQAFEKMRVFQKGCYFNRAGYDINTQSKLNYLIGYLPLLNSEIKRYEDVHDEITSLEIERARWKEAEEWQGRGKGSNIGGQSWLTNVASNFEEKGQAILVAKVGSPTLLGNVLNGLKVQRWLPKLAHQRFWQRSYKKGCNIGGNVGSPTLPPTSLMRLKVGAEKIALCAYVVRYL
ncbi:involucrin-like [Arachis ipaensis]|uniref:involucrin-like n=1 Tax=Arachis ipaensis TaxID=130454 RepID=UPI0007AFC418|nr:involucrin-like [Arachis ipaensis]XP_025628394.1 involucrin-like [Arachis hypogaea]